MQRPLYAVGHIEPIGFETIPDTSVVAKMDGEVVDWDVTASIRRQAYDAYLRAGFNRSQAIELCKIIEL